MAKKDPYSVIKNVHVTEKAMVLQTLHEKENNPSLKACTNPKYVFMVATEANKHEIAEAVESIYRDNKIKVVAVNTIRNKPKKRRVRGRPGFRPGFKKAIVTLEAGDSIEIV